jgi:hypothetical protein
MDRVVPDFVGTRAVGGILITSPMYEIPESVRELKNMSVKWSLDYLPPFELWKQLKSIVEDGTIFSLQEEQNV